MPPPNVGQAAATLAAIIENATETELSELGGETALFGRETPPGPAERVPDVLAGADAIAGVVPQIDRSLLSTLRRDAEELDVSVVVTGRARERLTGSTRLAARTLLEERGVSVFVHDGDSPVGILLVDDRAVIGLFEAGTLAAALVTDAAAVREWAVASFRRYRDASEPLFA